MNVREENKVKRRSKNENESNNPLSYSSSDNINTTSNGLSLTYFGGLWNPYPYISLFIVFLFFFSITH